MASHSIFSNLLTFLYAFSFGVKEDNAKDPNTSLVCQLKDGNNIMYTFTIVVHTVNVYIILIPPLIDY